MSVALLLFFGIATSSQATFIPADKTAGNHFPGGWGTSYIRPLARHHNWRQTYSSTTGVQGLGLYFAWKMHQQEDNPGENQELVPTNGKPVPEPSIIALFGLGLFGLGLARRRIRK